ncbi:MAG: cytochrome c oxidase subunit II [Actinobacteria bacterium]|nr:cytochrome c oxidase subunit II [Actinomycetota bacterium]
MVALSPLLLASCQIPSFGAYRGSTSQGQDTFKLYQGFFITGIVVVAIVFTLIIWSVFRYRRSTDEIPRQTQYHTFFEIVYTVIPILIVLVLFTFTVITENNVDATQANPPVAIKVTAFQWGWQFNYTGHPGVYVRGETVQDPEMVMPVGVDVQITLVSLDVVHGFYVPQFNFSRYALPGVTNVFDFKVLRPGVYRGQCTQLCGLYHSLMIFRVKAVTPSQFRSWIAQKQAAASLAGSNLAGSNLAGRNLAVGKRLAASTSRVSQSQGVAKPTVATRGGY